MGILRTDRVSGLGGANAIKGSVEFRAAQNLRLEVVNSNADFNLGSGDFTIECWYNPGGDTGTTDEDLLMLWNNTNSRRSYGLYYDNSGYFGFIGSSDGTNSDMNSYHSYNFPDANAWYHLAAVRISNTISVYINGVLLGTASTSASLYENTVDNLVIGGQLAGTNYDSKIARGFLSNVRMIKGDGIYTGAFTPPTNELTVTANTVLLACQSSGNILQEATGKTLIAYRSTSNDSFPLASTFTPNSPVGFSTTTDVGTQFGSTFDGVTTFDSQAYMVPPAGNTRERNRGRGVISGGRNNHAMQFVNIQSQGNSQTFGDSITGDGIEGFAVGSSTRGLFSGGYPSVGNVIEFITFATTSNGTDFGDMTTGRRSGAGAGNETRGLFAGGLNSSGTTLNTIEFSTIATLGNSTDFGDLTATRDQLAGCSDTTRAIFAGGKQQASPSPEYNIIDFVTIATTGNAQDFGDISQVTTGSSASSDSTRGIIVLGYTAPGPMINIIEFVTIQTTGNAQDFGDLIQARYLSANMSNSIRAVIAGGGTPSASNTIDFVTIKTTGNALDFGDLVGGANFVNVGTSDSHGGLS